MTRKAARTTKTAKPTARRYRAAHHRRPIQKKAVLPRQPKEKPQTQPAPAKEMIEIDLIEPVEIIVVQEPELGEAEAFYNEASESSK